MAAFRKPTTAVSPNEPCATQSHMVCLGETDRMPAVHTGPAATFLRSTTLRSRAPSARETLVHAARPAVSVVSKSGAGARGLEFVGMGSGESVPVHVRVPMGVLVVFVGGAPFGAPRRTLDGGEGVDAPLLGDTAGRFSTVRQSFISTAPPGWVYRFGPLTFAYKTSVSVVSPSGKTAIALALPDGS